MWRRQRREEEKEEKEKDGCHAKLQ